MIRSTIILTLFASTSILALDRSVGQGIDPTANEILQKYVQALGGEELLNSVTSMKLTATQTARNPKRTIESTDTILVSEGRWVNSNSLGTRSGYDGSRHWLEIKGGKPKWRNDVRYPFNIRDPVSYPLHLVSFPGTIEFVEKTDFHGSPAFRLAITPSDPTPARKRRMSPLELVFDAETGLLVQIVFDHKKVELADYRNVDGVMVPFQQKIVYRFDDISSEYEILIRSIEFNVKLDDSFFVVSIDGADE